MMILGIVASIPTETPQPNAALTERRIEATLVSRMPVARSFDWNVERAAALTLQSRSGFRCSSMWFRGYPNVIPGRHGKACQVLLFVTLAERLPRDFRGWGVRAGKQLLFPLGSRLPHGFLLVGARGFCFPLA
jgi:hypothetical protein